MFILLIEDFPVAAAIDGVAIDFQPISHGAKTFDLFGDQSAVPFWPNVDQEIAVAADYFDHFMDDAFNRFVFVSFEIAKRTSKRRAALPLGADHFEFQVVFFSAAHTSGPVEIATFVVAIHWLPALCSVVHEISDHAEQLVVKILNLGFRFPFADLVAVAGKDREIVQPQEIRLILRLNLFPTCNIVVDIFLRESKGAIERSGFGNEFDFF